MRRGEATPSQRLVTISLITSITLVAMVLVLAWGRVSRSDPDAKTEASTVLNALSQELIAQKLDLQDWLNHFETSPHSARTKRFDYLFLLSSNRVLDRAPQFDDPGRFEPFADALAPLVDGGRSSLVPGLRGPLVAADGSIQTSAADLSDGLFILNAQGAFAVSAANLPAALAGLAPVEAKQPIALGLRKVSPNFLTRVSHVAGISNLEIGPHRNADESVISIPLGQFGNGLFASWRIERPGDRLIGEIGSFAVSLAALFAGLLAYYATVRLADSESLAKRLAGHDLLSGLANRFTLANELDVEITRCRENGRGMALLCIDLDRFKEVNDTHGHDAGDRLIVQVAQRLKDSIRVTDLAARLGGDEFALIQSDASSRDDCTALAERLLALVAMPIDIGGGTFVQVGMSIGIAMFPNDGDRREILMRNADLALYRAKRDGRNRYCFFEAPLFEEVQIGKSTEDDLRRAIETNQLRLYYQPIVSPDGGRMVGVEALVRWYHPHRGMIFPDDFISLAESRGLIAPLGEWVLRNACEDARKWPSLRVAVNVSALQFRHRGFVRTVERVLAETQINPQMLELELTESVVIEEVDATEAAMFELRSLGLRLALDDFGTSYSSLIYLRRFAFDKIKIDKSFLASLEETGENAIIVHSVVHLGRALGLTVTAEGIETLEQQRFLQLAGAHELQGYLFSRPVTADEITHLYNGGCVMPPPRPEAADEQEDFVLLRGAA